MKIAIIYPPFFHKAFNENLSTVDDEFGLFPHINFGYIKVACDEVGVDCQLFDAAAQMSSYSKCLESIKRYNPDILAFSAHAAQTFEDILKWAKMLKRDLDLPFLVGGYEAKNYPLEIMSHTCFDYLCSGEIQVFFERFIDFLKTGKSPEKVPDFYYREKGSLKYTFPGLKLKFSEYPIPDRSIFDNSLYYSHVSQRKNFTIGMSSIGCPFPCEFCCMANTGFDGRAPEQMVQEMSDCVEKHGIHEIDWFDPVMLQNRRRSMEFTERLKEAKLDMIWSTRTRIDNLERKGTHRGTPDEELIASLADSGCKRLFLGIESGDDDILAAISKRQSVKNMKKTLDCAKEHGIMLLGFFMVGNPGETEKTAMKTIELSKSLPLDYAQFSITVMKPHTQLFEKYKKSIGDYDYWKEYMLGNVEAKTLPTPWVEMPREQMEHFAKKGYLHFYFRPKYILKMLLQIKSSEELFRYIRVAIQIALSPIVKSRSLGFPKRLWRAVCTFFEGIFALMKKHGTRHPISNLQGNVIKRAWIIASEEWKK